MGKRKSQGLGDSIEKFTEATGIKKAVELFSEVTGLDCGCDERKEKLNKIFPYKNVNCLNEPDYIYLKDFFATNPSQLSVQMQRDLSGIYKNVFNVNLEASACSSCWRDYVSQIRRIYNEY
jgi:hypothetical protein